ncbi:lipoprotein [Clostridium gelidum]|uniref:Lipoprotein n=1 Tax=Clostridium gelidum TaxID=704125 RepID=A0ABN6IPS1_9CLOT|nr:efflux RND transporter periplasmic adaptor subunit [Clostridium gelidum]BCZ44185.1 lipoprotein [Clostridium gelidum]
MPKLDIKKLKPKGISLKGLKLKKKPSKKVIIFGVIFVIIVAFIIVKVIMPKPALPVKHTVLSKGKIINSINVLGEINSKDTTNVYSTLSNPVKEVKVHVGDKVKAGDVLATLDSDSLEKDVKQLEATTVAAEANAKSDLENKKKAYDNASYLYDNNLNTEIRNAEEALKSAKLNLADKKRTHENNKALYDADALTKNDLNKSEIEYSNAQSDYDKAGVAIENVKVRASQDLDTAKSTYEAAETAYNNKSQRITLEKQQSELEKCEVKTPIDGTITVVNAVVGNPGTGTLFEVENLDDMEIKTSIKEVDIANVKVGQRTEIKTDTTGELVIAGEIVSVSPSAKKGGSTPIKADSQSTSSSSDTGFETKIKINDINENMKPGMSARVNVILNEKSDIYTIASDSIVQNENGKSIYVAEKSGEKINEYIIKELPIETGLESDFNVEISGEGITDGIIIIDDPLTSKVGDKIQINEG